MFMDLMHFCLYGYFGPSFVKYIYTYIRIYEIIFYSCC